MKVDNYKNNTTTDPHQWKDFILEGSYNNLPPDDFLYDRKGPWPQPSPNHPFGEAAAVLHIPFVEVLDWWLKIGSRYVFQWFFTWPCSMLRSLKWGGLSPVSDEEFSNYFYHSSYAKFLTKEMNVDQKKMFSPVLNASENAGKNYLLVDFVGMKILKPIKGVYTEACMVLFEEKADRIVPVAINLRDYLVYPKDGDLWMLGKFVALMGAGNHIVVATHPRLHFPMDSINAITKSAVPMSHKLFKLIIPHTELTLKLNYQVLNNPISLLQNKSWMVYAPFPASGESMRDLVVLGYHGIKDNFCYPKYFFPLSGPQKVYSSYGTFHEQYYKVYFDFVKEVLSDIKMGDEIVTAWANYIHMEIPSFPNGEMIWKDDNFYHAVASYIWDVSLGHAADHKTYAEIPLNKNPMRIRIPSPEKKDASFKLNLKKVVSFMDQTKLDMGNKLFFKPVNVSTLVNVDYPFTSEKDKKSVKKFLDNLKEVEKSLKMPNYMPVDEIPVSIQY